MGRGHEGKRTDRLLQNTYVVDYVLQNMTVLEAEWVNGRKLTGSQSVRKREGEVEAIGEKRVKVE